MSELNGTALDVLHGLRIKGMAREREIGLVTGAAEEEVSAGIAALAAAGLVERAPEAGAWFLTQDGLAAHGEHLAAADGAANDGVAAAYDSFLDLNDLAKRLISGGQQGAIDEEELLQQLEEIAERAGEALDYAARAEPRFGVYGKRLEVALEKIGDGDQRYVGDPALDSFHTIWFECHEDFLLTLGLSREE